MHIRSMVPEDLRMLARHQLRHSRENGRDGDYIFAPSEDDHPFKEEDIERETKQLLTAVTSPKWMRTWILTDESEIFGEITLIHRPELKASLHRCLMMMGIERMVRGQGWGNRLMQVALEWAKAQPSLEWITLNVFENNPPAKALYTKFGFKVVGTTRDMFRVFGQSIDDTKMVLDLRSEAIKS